MFIRTTKSPTSDLVKVYLVEGYRDENGKSKQRIVKSYGNLHELEAKDPNILEKLKAEAKKMPSTTTSVSIDFDTSNTNDARESDKNYGYFFLEALYKELGIDRFLKSHGHAKSTRDSLNEILKLLTFSRILDPASKRATVARKDEFFAPFKVSLDGTYEGLSALGKLSEDLQLHLHQEVSQKYGRDASLIFFDVTNYYFETDLESDLKQPGVSKEKKRNPIVQMALAIDNKGLPVGYRLFPGNTSDAITMIPTLEAMKASFSLDRMILTADKALNSGTNLLYLLDNGDGYIVSQKIRGASKAFINTVLDDEGYRSNSSGSFKIKSFLRDRIVKDKDGKKVKITEKVICFWSADFDAREKHKRQRIEERLDEYISNPSKYKASNKFGVKKYLKEVDVDTTTGEVTEKETKLTFDQERYDRDVALDGYYALVTSELEMPDEKVIEKYRGLWKIEDSFRVVKSDLEGRPVFVRRDDRIAGHFLICFLALLFCRILELKLDGRFSVRRIQESLKSATCRRLAKGFYSLNKQDDVFRALEEVFGVNLNYSELRVEELKQKKKEILHNAKN